MDVTERSGDHGIVQKKCLFLCNFSNRLLRHIISESQRHVQIARDPKCLVFIEPLPEYIDFRWSCRARSREIDPCHPTNGVSR